jgi:3',5'-cyclic AMP phosphodiesterase CpdA
MTSIIQIADVHFGAEDKEAIAALGSKVAELDPDITVICGDITQNGKKAEFAAARDWISQLPGPKIITPGNHDTPMFGLAQRLFDPFGRFNDYIAPLSVSQFTDQHVSIVELNTARGWQAKTDWSLGAVNAQALETAIDNLMMAPPATVKMLAVHHPLIYPPSSPLQKETKHGVRALKRLSASDIDVVLSGHVHTPFFLQRQPDQTDIMSIGAGTLSTRRRNKPASFNHLEIDKTHIIKTEIYWQSGVFLKTAPEKQNRPALRSWPSS